MVFSRHTYYSAYFPYWQKNDIFLIILFIKMSFFHYNIAKAFFAIKFVRHRIWKEWKKYSNTNDFEAFIYCDKGIYKSIKILGWNSGRSPMLHPKGKWRIFDKEKSNIFLKRFCKRQNRHYNRFSYTLPAYAKRVNKKWREQAPALRCMDVFQHLSQVSHLFNKCTGLCHTLILFFR